MVIQSQKGALGWVSRWGFSSSEAKGAAYRPERRHESMIDGGRNRRFSLVRGCRVQLEKEMSGTETRKARRSLIKKSIKCFSESLGLF